ncbi:MAG: Gfo/Idh/MocA family protein [Bryobacteraceae bacterium]
MRRRAFVSWMGAAALEAANGGSVRVGVITQKNGPHLSAYLGGLAESPEAGPIALCDASGATVDAARKALGSRLGGVYTDAASLLAKEKPAVTFVVLEASVAPAAITAALDAGSHVMAEKPACVRLADFEALARKAQSRNRQLMLALANRVDPVMVEARRLIQGGHLGKLYGAELHTIADQTRLTRADYRQAWYAQKAKAGGGHLIWLGIHWIDLAMYLTGRPVREVSAFTTNIGGQPLDVEDSAVVSFRFDGGALGTLTSGYYLDKGKQLFIKVWGSEGWLEIEKEAKPQLKWYTRKEGGRQFEGPLTPSGYSPFVRAVVRSGGGAPPPLTTEDSLMALRTVFASYRSAETGKAQPVAAVTSRPT